MSPWRTPRAQSLIVQIPPQSRVAIANKMGRLAGIGPAVVLPVAPEVDLIRRLSLPCSSPSACSLWCWLRRTWSGLPSTLFIILRSFLSAGCPSVLSVHSLFDYLPWDDLEIPHFLNPPHRNATCDRLHMFFADSSSPMSDFYSGRIECVHHPGGIGGDICSGFTGDKTE